MKQINLSIYLSLFEYVYIYIWIHGTQELHSILNELNLSFILIEVLLMKHQSKGQTS